jgi:general secretion pathway protein G
MEHTSLRIHMKRRPLRPRRRCAPAFTLVEILITIALIAGLATLLVVNYGNIFGGAQEDTARNWIKTTGETALTAYRAQVGDFPKTSQGLQALITRPEGVERWSGPYIKGGELPTDPWGNPYQYAYPAKRNTGQGKWAFDLYSFGPDGQEGGGDDITNWN